MSVDPLTRTFPFYTPYQFAGNKPIMATDLDDLEEKITIHYTEINPETGKIQVRDETQFAYEGPYTGLHRDAAGFAWSTHVGVDYDGGIAESHMHVYVDNTGREGRSSGMTDNGLEGVAFERVRYDDYGMLKRYRDGQYDAWLPDGLKVGIGYDAYAGPGTSGELGLVWLFRGPDASVIPTGYADFATGFGNGVSGTVRLGALCFDTDDDSEVRAFMLGGRRHSVSLSGSRGPYTGGVNYSVSEPASNGVRIMTYGIEGGAGTTTIPVLGPLGGNYNFGETSTTADAESDAEEEQQ